MKRKSLRKRQLILSLLIALVVLAGVAGLVVPVSVTSVREDGRTQPALLLNPSAPQALQGECASPGQLKIVLLTGAIRTSSDPQSMVIGRASLGDAVCLLDKQETVGRVVDLTTGVEGWLELKAVPPVAVLGLEDALNRGGVAQAVGGGEAGLTVLSVAGAPQTSQPPSSPPSGETEGAAGVVVSQALRLRSVAVSGSATGLGLVSDEGTAATIAVETTTGSTFFLDIALVNTSGASLTGELQVTVPEGVSLASAKAVPPDAVTAIGQFSPGVFKFSMVPSSNSAPDVRITVKVGLSPGFQTIELKLKQVAF